MEWKRSAKAVNGTLSNNLKSYQSAGVGQKNSPTWLNQDKPFKNAW